METPTATPREHDLKCWPAPFQAITEGLKAWEWRLNDRHYRVGDHLLLREWDPRSCSYTGRSVRKKVTYMLESGHGLPDGYCIMSLGDVAAEPDPTQPEAA